MQTTEYEVGAGQITASARGSRVKLKKLTAVQTKTGMILTGQSQKPNAKAPPFQLELDEQGIKVLLDALGCG